MLINNNHWLIKNSNKITQWTFIVGIVIGILWLAFLSIVIQDVKYPKAHPYLFTLETLLFSLGCSAIVFLMAYGRGTLTRDTFIEFLVLSKGAKTKPFSE